MKVFVPAKASNKKDASGCLWKSEVDEKVLTPDQYRKYVTLLNVTNNNNRALNL